MIIDECTIEKGSVYAKLTLESSDIAVAGSVQGAVKSALEALTQEKGIPALNYTRVTAMDDQPDGSVCITLEAVIPPTVILGPYKGVVVDIGHCEDFEQAAIEAAARNLRVAVPELMIQRKIDSILLEKQTELIESLSLNTLADIRAVLDDVNETAKLRLDDETLWKLAMNAAENYISLNAQDIGSFVAAFEGLTAADDESIVRAAERRAHLRGRLPAEQIAQEVFDAWLHTEHKSLEQWREEQRESAELMSRIDLLLAAVAEEEKLDASAEEFEQALNDLAAQYQMRPDDVLAAVGGDAIRHHIKMTKANQIIVDNAKNA